MDNMLTWNVRNWITVLLMFLLGWLVIMAIARFVSGRAASAGVGNYQPLVAQQVGAAGS